MCVSCEIREAMLWFLFFWIFVFYFSKSFFFFFFLGSIMIYLLPCKASPEGEMRF